MTTREWYRSHEGWIGALLLFSGAFALGILVSTMAEGKSCTSRIDALTKGYNALLLQKDDLIRRLSTSTAKASDAAIDASKAAMKASGEAKDAKH